ncbi:MAG: inner-rane translocator [Ilumatobacteraceae bacterium]|nr:inner-rane translocator [Ilumatobacteraceae bacterium]
MTAPTPQDPTNTSAAQRAEPALASAEPSLAGSDFSVDTETLTGTDVVRNYLLRFRRGGDLGLFPALLALTLLTALFGIVRPESFLSKFNFGNYFTQAAPICVLAMGVTFVLLLGEIDLGAGYSAGVCAALMASRLKSDMPLPFALLVAFAAAAVMGFLVGFMVAKVGVPSFIVTLSTFLVWQGVLLRITKEGGTIRIENKSIVAIENKNLSVGLGWVLFAVFAVGYGGFSLFRVLSRRRQNVAASPISIVLLKTAAIVVIGGISVDQLNARRGNNLRGVPVVVPLVILLVVILSFILGRTAWGRHLYAVGGNTEAARRAGINVARMKMSAFMVCTLLSCAAGIVLASRLNSVDPQTGGNDTLLIAIGAAVIGGTSLFGGRGRIINAVLGGLVFALINNGLPLLKKIGGIDFSEAGPKFIVNGLILLLFASIDATSRRRAAAN